ncbi:MAG: hypothetical protein RL588_971 [Pseudomonadota bacterium]|jgi:hypothetical protein
MLEDLLLEGAQPTYADNIRAIAARWEAVLPPARLRDLETADLQAGIVACLESGELSDDLILAVAGDLAALCWWRAPPLRDENRARLNALTRPILTRIADSLEMAPRMLPRGQLRRSHVLIVGSLLDPLHSPSGGAIDYAAALASDAATNRVEIVHSGEISPAMRAYIEARLGGFPTSRGVALISTRENPDFLVDILQRGACTFHIWCEPALSPIISVVSRLGPTLMFTCADEAPVQFADVYWYFQSMAHIGGVWKAQVAPQSFIDRYVQISALPSPETVVPAPVSRASIGIPEGAFVIATVGNRLGVEMDEAYITGVELAMRDRPNAFWLVVGGLPDYLLAAFEQVLGDRFLHVPFSRELDRLMTTVDVFANPFRAGGGYSASIALGAGAAVLSLARGDVSSLIPDSFVASDEEEYFRYLGFLMDSPEFLAAVKAEQGQYNARMRDQALFLKEIQGLVRLAADRYEDRGCGAPLSQTVFAPPARLAAAG